MFNLHNSNYCWLEHKYFKISNSWTWHKLIFKQKELMVKSCLILKAAKKKVKYHKVRPIRITPYFSLEITKSLTSSQGAPHTLREHKCQFRLLFVCLFLCCCFYRDRVSLCSPGCPETHSVDQAGLELRNPPASASQVLGLKVCSTTTLPSSGFYT